MRKRMFVIILLLSLVLSNLYMENTIAFLTDTSKAEVEILFDTTTELLYVQDLEDALSIERQVRAMIVPTIEDANGNPIAIQSEVFGQNEGLSRPNSEGEMIVGDVILQFHSDWENSWEFREGFFYYRELLQPGESPAELLKNATIRTGSTLVYQDNIVIINVLKDTIEI